MSDKKSPFRLLVIDDEVDSLFTLKKLIESMGNFEVLTASTVDDGIKKSEFADGILADINMPGKDKLTHFLEGVKIPVARFSGSETSAFNFMLHKPFTVTELNECLDILKKFSKNNKDLESTIKDVISA